MERLMTMWMLNWPGSDIWSSAGIDTRIHCAHAAASDSGFDYP